MIIRPSGIIESEVRPVLTPLSPEEEREFELCEADIGQCMVWRLKAGLRFIQIRDQKLYRTNYHSFQTYCVERWGHVRRQIDRLILAAQVVTELRPLGLTLPLHETHVRPLLRLPREQRVAAWQKVLTMAAGGEITARLVEEVVAQVLPQKMPRKGRAAAKATVGTALLTKDAKVQSKPGSGPPRLATLPGPWCPVSAKTTDSLRALEELIADAKMYVSSAVNFARAFAVLMDAERELAKLRTSLAVFPPVEVGQKTIPKET